jgi:Ni2+-binding GTPase involved in maturation of urease and hydrogenase
MVMSVTEGEDEPLEYPRMFEASELMILNKVDLLPNVRAVRAHEVSRLDGGRRRHNLCLQSAVV